MRALSSAGKILDLAQNICLIVLLGVFDRVALNVWDCTWNKLFFGFFKLLFTFLENCDDGVYFAYLSRPAIALDLELTAGLAYENKRCKKKLLFWHLNLWPTA